MKITEINAINQEVTERQMTDTEFAQYEADQEALVLLKAEAETKAQAKAVLLERLGLTQEEFNTLLA